MLTGMLAVRNIVLNEKIDLWMVNAEQEYHEEIFQTEEATLHTILNDAFARAFPKNWSQYRSVLRQVWSVGVILMLLTIIVAANQMFSVMRFLGLLN